MPRARWLLGCVLCDALCVESIRPLSGVPCPPFYRPRGEQGLQMGERGKTRGREGPSKVPGLPFSLEPTLLTWQMVLGIARSSILIGPCSGFGQLVVASHPTSTDEVARQGIEP